MIKFEDAKAVGRRAAKWGADRIKDRQEATAFGKAHGKSHTFANSIVSSPDPPLSRLILMADWLGMSVEELLGESEAEDGEVGRICASKHLPEIAQKCSELFFDHSAATGDCEIDSRLKELDDFRYENPVVVLQRLLNALESLAAEQIPYVLNIASSCYRMTLDFGESAVCAAIAAKMSSQLKNRLARGDNLQRSVYLLNNLNMKALALRRNSQSREQFVEASAIAKVGETIVDRGYCLARQGCHQESLDCYLAAGKLDHLFEFRTRVTWRQCAAVCFESLGKLSEARVYCDAAVELTKDLPRGALLRNQTLWQMGRIEGASRNIEKAESLIFDAANNLVSAYPADAAIATLEMVAIYIQTGYSERSEGALDRLAQLDGKLANIPQISEALQNIVSLAKMHRLTIGAVAACAKSIRENRARYYRALAAHSK